jgi:iron(III) transport system ATP-binding protein
MSIRISNLRKTFGPVVAVDRLSLDVAQGQMLVLLGPSGCGKTTTMRAIAGLDLPDEGSVAIGGRVVFEAGKVNVPANQRNVGMVFQSYAIWPHMTVFDNVAFPLRVKNLPRSEMAARVGEVLTQVGLSDLSQRGASYLSGGQMQRVALARSLVMRPSVLLFDEPLSNLDARLRDRLRIQLRELQTQHKITAVYVTHDQHEALALADQIAVMHHGRLLQLADPVAVYARPVSSTVADFIGYSNIFRIGEAGAADGHTRVVLDGSATVLTAAGMPPSGQTIFACIRPEDIGIAPADGAPGATPNRFDGEVIFASFMGSFMQYRVRIDGGETFEIVNADVARGIRIGHRVVLTIAPPAVRVLPSSGP